MEELWNELKSKQEFIDSAKEALNNINETLTFDDWEILGIAVDSLIVEFDVLFIRHLNQYNIYPMYLGETYSSFNPLVINKD